MISDDTRTTRLSSFSEEGHREHTIAICTANRRDVVCETITNLIKVIKYPNRTQLIIVNNGKREDFDGIQQHMRRACLPPGLEWMVCHEPRPGVSFARNLVIERATGDIISFLDDDASPKSDVWQDAILQVFKEHNEVALCGGPTWLIAPAGFPNRPWWRSTTTDIYFSCLYNYPQGYCPPGLIAGLNASYRRNAIQFNRFRERLGWNTKGKLPLAGEETLFNEQVCGRQWRAWFENDAVVLHRIEPERYNTRWLLRRAFVGGKTEAVFEHIHGTNRFKVCMQASKHTIKSCAKVLIHIVTAKYSALFSELCTICSRFGVLSMGRLIKDEDQ